jgi:hypothetical protein
MPKQITRVILNLMLASENPIVKICVEGMSLEARGDHLEAAKLFVRAWQMARDDFEASIAAHYVARHQNSPEKTLYWNRISIDRANLASKEKVRSFYPSLYLNMGKSHEDLNHWKEAEAFYRLAEGSLGVLSDDRYGTMVRDAVQRGLERLANQPR